MPATIVPLFALLLSVSLLLMGNGLQSTLLPVRASIDAFSAIEIGVLGSAYFLGYAAGCIFGPHIVQRVGHIRTFTAMASVASCIVLAHAIAPNPVVWWVLRAATGICFAVLYVVIESWLSEKSSNKNRGTVFSIYTIINFTVVTAGQMMLTLDNPQNFLLFSLASILISLAAVPVALLKSEEPKSVKTVKIRFRHLLQTSPVGVIGCLAVGLTNGSFWALGPVFGQGGGTDTSRVAIFMSIVVIAGAVGQWPLGSLSDRIDRRRVIVLTCIGATCAGILLFVFSASIQSVLLPIAFFYGLFALSLNALCVAHTNDFADPSEYVEIASGLLLVYAVGAVLGPIIASVSMHFIGQGGLFAYTAMVHLSMAAFAVYRLRQRAAPPREEQMPFADAVRVAQTVSSVNPISTSEERHEP